MSIYDYITIGLVIVVLVGGAMVVLSSKGLLVAREYKVNNEEVSIEEIVQEPPLPKLGLAPELRGIVGWINSEPLNLQSLKGKVVLLDFWTYSCINCIRTLPYVESWHAKYKDRGFVLLGVHTPEFDFEKKKENVVEAVAKYKLTYPIAMDNDYATWQAFNNKYWPAHYLIDVEGNIRYTHFGEGKYRETEKAIVQLLHEGSLIDIEQELSLDAEDKPSPRPRGNMSPETYLGYKRLERLGNGDEDLKADEPFYFERPDELLPDRFYLTGDWKIGQEAAQLVDEAGGSIIYPWRGKEANLVMDAGDRATIKVEVLLNGRSVSAEMAGVDIVIKENRSYVAVTNSRLYNLIRADQAGEYELELIMSEPGLRAYAYTFG